MSWYRITLRQVGLIVGVVFFALMPDIDFLFGYPAGNPNLYHHQATHSLVFVLAGGILAGWLWGRFYPNEKRQAMILFSAAGMLHLLLDLLSVDTSAPYGMPLLWPFWSGYIIAPVQIFSDVHRSSDSRDFLISLCNRHNLNTILLEIAILSPLVVVMTWWRRRSR